MPSKQAKEMWENGIGLRNAWFAFAPSELRDQFEQIPSFAEGLAKAELEELLGDRFMAVARAWASTSERPKLESRMKEALVTDLFNAELVATAYRQLPSRSQSPVCIDPLKFDLHDPDWESETFEADGIRYIRVRVSKPILSRAGSPAKGSRQLIDDTIDGLLNSDPGFCQLPRKVACEAIRNSIGAERNSGNGLSDKNLEKAILRKCGPKAIRAN